MFSLVSNPSGEEDLGGDAEHPAGHDGAGRLRRVTELHPQPVLRVGQVQRVGRLLEQAQPGQEASQPAGDRALLLHCEEPTNLLNPLDIKTTFDRSLSSLLSATVERMGVWFWDHRVSFYADDVVLFH